MSELNTKPCWRKNGTWGNEKPRCEKLKFVEHCRNCNVFEDAAKKVMVHNTLEQGFDGELLSFEAAIQRQQNSGDCSILPVRLDQYCFAIPCNQIVTIHDHIPIHSVPFNQNAFIQGVVAINHEIYTFVNFTKFLALPNVANVVNKNRKIGLYKRVLVVDFGSRTIAFYVDEVYPIFRYFQAAINETLPALFLDKLSNGFLLADNDWCSDCYILDSEKISKEFEGVFNDG